MLRVISCRPSIFYPPVFQTRAWENMMTRSLSLYLDLLRLLAALAVYLFHVSYFAKVRIPVIGNLGSEAVIVFFVLSGFLVTAAGMRQPDLERFAQARLSRLWSVCLPALLLTLMIDLAGQYISLSSYHPMQPYSLFKWIASMAINALFLNQIWNLNIYPGTNGPFWSLSYEFWYYMIFAACFYYRGLKRVIAVILAALIAGPLILAAFPIWLLGTFIYFALRRGDGSGKRIGWILWLSSFVAAYAYWQFELNSVLREVFPELAASAQWGVNFWPASYLIGLMIAVNIYGFALMRETFLPMLEKFSGVIRVGAGLSFGLYLFHYPLMYFFKALLHASGVTGGHQFIIAMYALPFLVSMVLAFYAEKHKDMTTRALERAWALLRGRFRKVTIKNPDPFSDILPVSEKTNT